MTTSQKPSITIYKANANPIALSEICAGLEEEGVLYEVVNISYSDVKTLAYNAANHSKLRVGIGITNESAALQLKNLPIDKPIFTIELGTHQAYPCCRKLGTNAARAIKGNKLV